MNCADAAHDGLKGVLGEASWERLPRAVQKRFAHPAVAVDYVGSFDIVRASSFGRLLARLCRLIGTPVVPRTGMHVPAVVHVGPSGDGVAWDREYRWPDSTASLVCSTKVIGTDGGLIEKLPAGLCMPLDAYERAGILHFVSRGYYFELGNHSKGRTLKLWLPSWLSPGTTRVDHIDEKDGWFRFTMTVTHPVFGEVFYQTGRFHAAGD